jgi:putative membrane protein
MNILKLIGIGIILGISNVIPGVSGGTMAVVFGVYDNIIEDITLNIKKILFDWKFLLPLIIGLIVGILLFSKLITYLFTNYSVLTNWFFMGLIAGSIPLLFTKIQSSVPKETKFPLVSSIFSFIFAITLMIVMLFINPEMAKNTVPQTLFSLSLAIKLVVTGAIAAIAMIIPGISGSFFMLIIGMYTTVIAAISDLHISLLISVAIGVIIGLLGGARFIRFVMSKVPTQTYGAIMGLIIGSIVVIYPGLGNGIQFPLSLAIFFTGFSIAYFSSRSNA